MNSFTIQICYQGWMLYSKTDPEIYRRIRFLEKPRDHSFIVCFRE